MKRCLSVIVIFVFGIIMLSGCAGASRKNDISKSESFLEPQAMGKFNDIPAPAGFKSIPAESYAFESSGVRVGLLRYRGKADIEKVVNFYKDQMPLYNWNLLNVVEYGERMLNFEREQETCIINLSSKGRSITITVSLGPKSVTRAKRSTTPVK
ncbi:MAG: hypothetical protein WC301_01550 [Candidatus Omnitrophota bacterium]|jgi:hypothetical protein